jgi:hypothetical protein
MRFQDRQNADLLGIFGNPPVVHDAVLNLGRSIARHLPSKSQAQAEVIEQTRPGNWFRGRDTLLHLRHVREERVVCTFDEIGHIG